VATPAVLIGDYLDHLESRPYVEGAIAEHGVPALIAEVSRVAAAGEPATMGPALAFVRDAASTLLGEAIQDAVRDELPRSTLFDALDRCLYVPRYAVRAQATYTFGKLCFAENASRLSRALDARRELDPFMIERWLFEIRWLEQDPASASQRLHVLVDSPGELTRWAAAHVIGKEHRTEVAAQLTALRERLRNDASPFVRAEARGSSPRLVFDELEWRFTNRVTPEDYSVAEVEAYLASRRAAVDDQL
jgi:hypothetical protein